MSSIRSLAVAVPTLALLLGCIPLERGHDPAPSTEESGAGSGGVGGVSGSGPVAAGCEPCSVALGSSGHAALCPPAQLQHTALLDCACRGACAAACSIGGDLDCIADWEGNPPLQCKLCLLSKTGCGAAWDACMSEDGAASGGGVGASDGGNCACDPALPLCPGGGTCATPGGFTLPGNESCGSAQYCAPCCDPADPCAAMGTCEVTRIAQEPCSDDYECCSGVCNGICQGGCGAVLSF
jgi:hypothetical protein